ncbi:MAG: hypothetical protein NPIRA04_34880 [Nitrospirales bacterium]|nr:MAG: hypothetical protein NPIRA04_34880 [Nitrospirales bacterium]
MLDRDRILSKISALDEYLQELEQIVPGKFSQYVASIEKRRACERLLQILVEVVLDICGLFVSGLQLGLPHEDNDLFNKLEKNVVLSKDQAELLRSIRGFRNIVVHEYGGIDDAVVYRIATTRLQDFRTLKHTFLETLQKFDQK